MSIVEVDATDPVLLCKLEDFLDEQVPGLELSVVEHGAIIVVDRLSISAIADVFLAILVQVVK